MDVLANVFWTGLFVFALMTAYLEIDGTKYKDASNFFKWIGIVSFYPAAFAGIAYVLILIWS